MTDAMTRLQCRSVLRGRVWHAITYLHHHHHHTKQIYIHLTHRQMMTKNQGEAKIYLEIVAI